MATSAGDGQNQAAINVTPMIDVLLVLNSESVPAAGLRERLISLFARRARRVVFMKADDDPDFGIVAQAIDGSRGEHRLGSAYAPGIPH